MLVRCIRGEAFGVKSAGDDNRVIFLVYRMSEFEVAAENSSDSYWDVRILLRHLVGDEDNGSKRIAQRC